MIVTCCVGNSEAGNMATVMSNGNNVSDETIDYFSSEYHILELEKAKKILPPLYSLVVSLSSGTYNKDIFTQEITRQFNILSELPSPSEMLITFAQRIQSYIALLENNIEVAKMYEESNAEIRQLRVCCSQTNSVLIVIHTSSVSSRSPLSLPIHTQHIIERKLLFFQQSNSSGHLVLQVESRCAWGHTL